MSALKPPSAASSMHTDTQLDQKRTQAVRQTALMQDQGCSMRDFVAQGLVAYPDNKLASLEAQLRKHPSAVIRSRFANSQ